MKSKNKYKYDVLIIGGGISASVFASNYIKNSPNRKIAIVESGRSLGGRSSTRISRRFKNWKLNHGSPNLNILNKENDKLLDNFLDELLKKQIIQFDDSDLTQLSHIKSDPIVKQEFSIGSSYVSTTSMGELSQNIININNSHDQIDFYFETLIINLEFKQNQWSLISTKGKKFIAQFLICSSNLLLHKRSMKIFNIDQIPLRKAIPKEKNKQIDLLFSFLDKQTYISRLSFLIYSKANYHYKDFYNKKYRYFYLQKELEKKYKFERIIFQRQTNNLLGIVIQTKNIEFIESYLKKISEDQFKKNIIIKFNDLFQSNSSINQLFGDEEISIMRWRAAQPSGTGVPLSLQLFRDYKIGFCGDWFDQVGFGRIEGAILSALKLANKLKSFR